MRVSAAAALGLLLTIAPAGCGRAPSNAIVPEYDAGTGRLKLLKFDSNGDGKIDTWSYMDGNRVLRIEIDTDGNGTIDRWEYYGPNQQLERVALSMKGDGTQTRMEYYAGGAIVRAEEDTDGDGKVDKWETYEAGRLQTVAYDSAHRGTPDRRLVYERDGSARLEVDQAGDGHFAPAPKR